MLRQKISATWAKGKFKVKLRDNMTEEVATDLFGGWGVHKAVGASGWALTHLSSGKRLWGTKTKRDAKSLVQALVSVDPKLKNPSESYLESQKDIVIALLRDPSQWSLSSTKRKPKVSERREEIARMLFSAGLRSLGTRSGKAGEFYGIKGSSRAIAVGNRDILKNVFNAYQAGYGGRLQTSWGMYESKLISRISDAEVTKWAKWAKDGLTMIEVRNEARGKTSSQTRKAAMSDRNLRKKLIRLAHSKPELRSDLLPLLQKKAYWKAPRRITKTFAKQVAKSVEKPWTVQTLEEVRRAISKTILSKMSMGDMISYQKEVGDWANSLPDADLRNLVTWVYEDHYRGRQKGYTTDVERLKSATKNEARGKTSSQTTTRKAAMSDRNLRKKLIRLAHSKPELRSDILPLLKSATKTVRVMEEDGRSVEVPANSWRYLPHILDQGGPRMRASVRKVKATDPVLRNEYSYEEEYEAMREAKQHMREMARDSHVWGYDQ